jgi:phosphotransferase system HPr (HPr) family protein
LAALRFAKDLLAMRYASRRILVKNVDGVNLRAAVLLYEHARLFPCALRIRCEARAADAKNIWELLGLRAQCGSELLLEAQGPQSKQALDRLEYVVTQQFQVPGKELYL